jgi:hypothetical protein
MHILEDILIAEECFAFCEKELLFARGDEGYLTVSRGQAAVSMLWFRDSNNTRVLVDG